MVTTKFEAAGCKHRLKHIEHVEFLLVLLLAFFFCECSVSQHSVCEVRVLFDQVLASDHDLKVDETSNLLVVPFEKAVNVDHSLSELRPSVV